MSLIRLIIVLTVLPTGFVFAQEPTEADKPAEAENTEVPEGHSYHGEFLNEGPRQKAYLMGGTGYVDFKATSNHPEVPAFIDQGIGQFYGFWYLEAERSFRHAAALDPDCAIAYWGAALAALGNNERSKGFIEAAVKRKDKASDREKMYIDALAAYIKADPKKRTDRDAAYRAALENISIRYPDDLDAKALLCLQLYKNRTNGNYLAANALMEQIIAVQPLHSVHHFRIHLWDYKKAERALDSAAHCGQGSPSIAHMWHMPGHIYSKLKRYEDACWQQEASARVDHRHMMHDRVMPDQIHNYAHNNEWLIRNLNNVGRVRDAVELAKNMTQLPRHPKYNTLKKGSTRYGRSRLLETLERYELWEEAVTLCNSAYLEPTDELDRQIERSRLLGISLAETDRPGEAETIVLDLVEQLDLQKTDREIAISTEKEKQLKTLFLKNRKTAENEAPPELTDADREAIEKQHKKPIDAAIKKAALPFDNKIKALDAAAAGIEGHLALKKGEYERAYDKLKADRETNACLLARVQLQTEHATSAIEPVRKMLEKNQQEVQPQAGFVELLWLANDHNATQREFEKLRKMSGSIDMASPVFTRLSPIATELGLPSDWRLASEVRKDVGERPALDTLGPLHWSPSPAHDWELPAADGKTRTLKEFAGKPVVVIFYLGHACLHCAEQLQAFAPKYEEFQKAGLEMIAISTDDLKGLKISIDTYGDEPMPIPLISDDKLNVFKQWRVYDDFEEQPLHGTFVIDPDGRVLWQDISYEPFMEPDFVLAEAQRLLDQQRVAQTPSTGPKSSTSLKVPAQQ